MMVIDANGRKWLDLACSKPYRWYHDALDQVINWWGTPDSRDWRRRQYEFERTGTRYYGDGGTIHSTGHLHVETFKGTVVAVWFRCQPLPFEQVEVSGERATDMERMGGWPESGRAYGDNGTELHGVEVRP